MLAKQIAEKPFVTGDAASVADISLCAYLSFPPNESGYDFTHTHPPIAAWLGRIAKLPGWKAPYDLMPGQRLRCYVSP